MMDQTSTQYTKKKKDRTCVRKRRIQEFTLQHENKLDLSPGERLLAVKQKFSISAFFMCAAIVVQIEIWCDRVIYLQDISSDLYEQLKKKLDGFLEIFVLVIFLLFWNIINSSI